MLKGHVFSKQIFGNPIFALFINTFTGGKNGVSNDYGNGMAVTYSGNTVTVDNGAICIQGRFLEEDTSTAISAGTDNMFCKLVIEIDLDKQNTEGDFQQGAYRIIKSASAYPQLTQTDIVKNNSGIYQYELARFKTTSSGITDFQDQRTFLDFDSIYAKIQNDYESVLNQLKQKLANVEDGSAYILNSLQEQTLENDICTLKFKKQGRFVICQYTLSKGFEGSGNTAFSRELQENFLPIENVSGTFTLYNGGMNPDIIDGIINIQIGTNNYIDINYFSRNNSEQNYISGTLSYATL